MKTEAGVLAILVLLAGSSSANASALYDEIAAERTRVLGPTKLIPAQQLWREENHRKLMSIIDGVWVNLTDGVPPITSEEAFLKNCDQQGMVFKTTSEYSFEMFLPAIALSHGTEIHVDYIWKDGSLYNIRSNIEQQFEVFGKEQHNVLRNANQTSVLLVRTPNLLLEVSADHGLLTLWGRCPT